MRLILSIVFTIITSSTAFANTPESCQTLFGKEHFTSGGSYFDDSEITALLHELNLTPLRTTLIEEDELVLDLYMSLFYEEVLNAIQARAAYEATFADFADGEISREQVDLMRDAFWHNPQIRFIDQHAERVVEHIGHDHKLAPVITEVNACLIETLIMMGDDYRELYMKLNEHFLAIHLNTSE